MAYSMKGYKNLIIGSVIGFIIILLFVNSQPIEQSKEANQIDANNIEKIEIIHFHGHNQCASCIARKTC